MLSENFKRRLRLDRARALPLTLAAVVALGACGGGDAPEGGEAPDAPAAAQDGPTIIVSGASGELGGMVVDQLLDRGVAASRLILVSRTPDQLSRYADMGASTRFGDFTQPESLPAAYEGGERMLLISIETGVGENRAELHGNAIDAAAAAGVQHIVYTSLIDAPNNDSPLAADHVRTEELLRESGVTWTFLRNSLYMDPLVEQAIDMIFEGLVERSDQGASYVTRYDIARTAAAVLTGEGHENMAYDITGPAVVHPQDVAEALVETTEMPVRVIDGDGSTEEGMLSEPSFQIVSDAVEEITGQPPMSIHDLLLNNHDYIMAGTGA